MATVKFYLSNPFIKGTKKLREDEVSIELMFTLNRSNRFPVATKERIQPKYWDKKKQEVKTNFKGSLELNIYLSDLKKNVLELWRANRDKSVSELKGLVRGIVRGEDQPDQKKTVLEVVRQFIVQSEKEKDSGTIKRYKGLLTKLERFTKVYPLSLDKLDFNFYDRFKNFLYAEPNPTYAKHRIDYNDHLGCYTVSSCDPAFENIGLFDDIVFKYVVLLKTVCAWAEKRGETIHPAYKQWEIIKREYTPITLTKDELERIEALDLKGTDDIARDYLVLECRTGQRISDIRRFSRQDINDDVWVFYQKKGNRLKAKLIELPLDGFSRPALVILQKYRYELPRLSEQKINGHIKEICKQAGIIEPISIERWAGSKKVRFTAPKNEFISTHTGKKSFITIMASEGVPVSILSLITGTSQKTIERHYLGRIEVSKVREHLKKASGESVSIMRKHA